MEVKVSGVQGLAFRVQGRGLVKSKALDSIHLGVCAIETYINDYVVCIFMYFP